MVFQNLKKEKFTQSHCPHRSYFLLCHAFLALAQVHLLLVIIIIIVTLLHMFTHELVFWLFFFYDLRKQIF